MERIIVLTALGDNYIYLYRYEGNKVFVVDPGAANPVLTALRENRLELTHILLTHRHFDHIGGVKKLKSKTRCRDDGLPGDVEGRVVEIATAGHTKDSVCYFVEGRGDERGVVFTGDTLFTGGCGRPMECPGEVLWESLKKLKTLPDETLVFPGHDYTEENYRFALTIEPDNQAISEALANLREAKKQGSAATATSIAFEKKTNIFLRADEPAIKAALNIPDASDGEAFVELRKRKNKFG
jgi:hydroxyacylglutathione hydrolase